ncbi:MAG: 6-pyruvoyl tetrahydropterin synthase family protein [Gemmatales bacterium]|nr:6-pyruvoyl tetrahydropterin synthase family protein [Gemmatales bacterium]MDW8388158.1 6-pyruvoyl tetrahydropterin synthase family protein [Gemmatales bacterium]
MSERFTVRIVKEQLVFCSGHFISYEGDKCERLHGHNYRVGVEVTGPLDENRYVFDFIALKRLTRALVEELDHRMLLPLRNPHIRIESTANEVTASYRQRRWVFPREDCVLLPIANTTAEELAGYLAGRLRSVLAEQYGFVPESLRVEVEEAPGQSAVYEWRPEPTASGTA